MKYYCLTKDTLVTRNKKHNKIISRNDDVDEKIEDDNKEDDDFIIEGYFSVFNKIIEISEGFYEQIHPDAYNKILNTKNIDIKALYQHNTEKVIGRTKNNTLRLNADDKGLYGTIVINKNDNEARDIYYRVRDGYVTECSIGFMIDMDNMDTDKYKDGFLYTLKSIDLFEVSIVTFPAYPDTYVNTRNEMIDIAKKRCCDYNESLEVKSNKQTVIEINKKEDKHEKQINELLNLSIYK